MDWGAADEDEAKLIKGIADRDDDTVVIHDGTLLLHLLI